MAIRGDSWGSTTGVLAYTRHLLDGQSAFNSTTRPTGTELVSFIDRASGLINVHLWRVGINPATVAANSTASLPLDDWVITRAAEMVELTQRGVGYSGEEGSRTAVLAGLLADVPEFVDSLIPGFERMGLVSSDPDHQGLTFTGLTAQKDRSDRDDSGRTQPRFERGKFDQPG